MKISSIAFYFVLINVSYSRNGKMTASYEKLPVSSEPYEVACALNYHNPLAPDSDPSVAADGRQSAVSGNPPQPSAASEPVSGCQCVPYFLCNKNRSASQDVDIRAAFLSGVGLVSAPPYKPCPCPQASSSPRVGAGVCRNYLDVCCGSAPEPEALADEPPSPPHSEDLSACGQVAEEEDRQGRFPWMVAVFGDRIVNGRVERFAYLCGGSLISLSAVLTAAHCVKGESGLLVRAGVWDLPISKEPLLTQDRPVHHVVIHEEYYAGALYNDVALLFLESPVDSAANVVTVCLPQQGESMEGHDCVASGWGKDVIGGGKYEMSVRRVELPIVSRDGCQEAFRSTILGQYFRLHESFICAGGQPGKDTCKGDGGSALVCASGPGYMQAGVVSWGMGCGGSTPGAYVNVPHFRTWIDNKLATFSVDDSRYRSLQR